MRESLYSIGYLQHADVQDHYYEQDIQHYQGYSFLPQYVFFHLDERREEECYDHHEKGADQEQEHIRLQGRIAQKSHCSKYQGVIRNNASDYVPESHIFMLHQYRPRAENQFRQCSPDRYQEQADE